MQNKLTKTRCRMARFDVCIVIRQIKFAIISELANQISERNAVSFEYSIDISRVENCIDRAEDHKRDLNFNRGTRSSTN